MRITFIMHQPSKDTPRSLYFNGAATNWPRKSSSAAACVGPTSPGSNAPGSPAKPLRQACYAVDVKQTVSRKHGNAALALESHPLARLRSITVKLEWDPETANWMSFIPELNNISTFGKTQEEALEHTRDLLRGYLETCEAHGCHLPLTQQQIHEIRTVVR